MKLVSLITYSSILISVAVLGTTEAFSLVSIPSSKTAHFKATTTSTTTHINTARTYRRFRTQARASAVSLPRVSGNDLKQLSETGYVVIEDFLPLELQQDLRNDIQNLRSSSRFKVAKIGQDSTNSLNTDIRVAETCFVGPSKLLDLPDEARSTLYNVLDQVRQDLPQPLDQSLSELLYVFYPKGGFYRRHRDAIPGSASVLREYSLLLYLNTDWKDSDGGRLRMHFDSGGDFLPEGEEPSFQDVDPKGGTLVLFRSDKLPHEVLDTTSERMAIVGWYNRPLTASDIGNLSGEEGGSVQTLALAVALGLITVGLINIIG